MNTLWHLGKALVSEWPNTHLQQAPSWLATPTWLPTVPSTLKSWQRKKFEKSWGKKLNFNIDSANFREMFVYKIPTVLIRSPLQEEIPKIFNKLSLITHPLFYSVTNICINTMPVVKIFNVSTFWSTYYKTHLHSLTLTRYKQTLFITLRTGKSREDCNILRSSTARYTTSLEYIFIVPKTMDKFLP
jgi:hypothetical protein